MKRTIFVLALAFILMLFAVPIVTAQENAQPPYLGLTFDEHENGVLVTRVLPDSPAAEADLQVGDVITTIDGDAITFEDFADVIGEHHSGDTLPLTVLRDEASVDVEIVLGERPETDVFQAPLPMDAFAFIQDGDQRVWQVRSLTENHPLYEAGLRAGDTITEFNGEIYTPGDLRDFLTELEEDATVTLTIERDDEELEIDAPASALESLDRFSLGFSFSDDAGEQIPFNEFFNFEPFDFFGSPDALSDRLNEMLERFLGEEGFPFNIPQSLLPEQANV